MKSLLYLDEVVQELERDINITRIKKLLIFVCKKIWESDENKLKTFNLQNLIEELYVQNDTLINFQSVLTNRLNKINKKSDYIPIAETIFFQISKLYESREDRNKTFYQENDNSDRLQLEIGGLKEPPYYKPDPENHQLSDSYNLFDVRQKIMQGTNPLIAKILIFSTLYHKFTFSDRDWSLLKDRDIDELVRNLFHACYTLNDLKSQLYKTAKILENSDKHLQAANVIFKNMTSLYASAANNSNHSPQFSTDLLVSSAPSGINESENTENNGRSGPFYNDENDGGEHREIQDVKLMQVSGDRAKVPNPAILNNENHKKVNSSPAPLGPETTDSEEKNRKFSLAALNISESIKQKREQEKKIKEAIAQNVNIVMNVMENTLSELENTLEPYLQREQPEDYLSLKYQALGDFIENVQETSAKFREILSKLEEAERQHLSK